MVGEPGCSHQFGETLVTCPKDVKQQVFRMLKPQLSKQGEVRSASAVLRKMVVEFNYGCCWSKTLREHSQLKVKANKMDFKPCGPFLHLKSYIQILPKKRRYV